jgi:hypothetical protein
MLAACRISSILLCGIKSVQNNQIFLNQQRKDILHG